MLNSNPPLPCLFKRRNHATFSVPSYSSKALSRCPDSIIAFAGFHFCRRRPLKDSVAHFEAVEAPSSVPSPPLNSSRRVLRVASVAVPGRSLDHHGPFLPESRPPPPHSILSSMSPRTSLCASPCVLGPSLSIPSLFIVNPSSCRATAIVLLLHLWPSSRCRFGHPPAIPFCTGAFLAPPPSRCSLWFPSGSIIPPFLQHGRAVVPPLPPHCRSCRATATQRTPVSLEPVCPLLPVLSPSLVVANVRKPPSKLLLCSSYLC